ncbi:MAG TPA: toll/interleukin-1 receptor domain-containing protein, partial [Rhodocyclaceae bacterium]
MTPLHDLFISYRHDDQEPVDRLVAALEAEELAVWLDRNEVDDAGDIQARITQGLAQSKALLAWFSARYPASRACQWEITAALIAARADTGPTHRVLAVNPEPGDEHIRPLAARNIQHFAAPGTDADFAKLARQIAAVIQPIPGPLGALRSLAAPRSFGFKPLGSNRFVGRVTDLWQIHDALARGDYAIVAGQPSPQAAGQLAQVQGSGGIGKSLLAEEYALRFGTFWPGGIFWLRAYGNPDNPAESAETLARRRAQEYSTQLAGFAADQGIDPKGMDDAQLRRALAHRLSEAGQPYLWIVDDLHDCPRRELEAWLAPGPLGQTLITTRSRRQDGLGYSLPLGLLPEQDARELLTRQHPPGEDELSAVAQILRHLDGHALALDVARVACLRQGYARFLESLVSPSKDALALAAELAPELPSGHNPSIAVTFLAGFADLPEAGCDFLRLAAQLATAPIERRLVATCFALGDELSVEDAEHRADMGMQQALDRSLAEAVAESTAVTVHTLIGRTLRFHDRNADRQTALRQSAVAAISHAMQSGVDIRAHAQLEHVVVHARTLADGTTDQPGLDLAGWIGRYEYEAAHYVIAGTWLRAVLQGRTQLLGNEHPDTLTAMNNLAHTLQAQGDLAAAHTFQESVLAARRRLLGEEHPDTLASMHNLASTLKALGDLAAARALEEFVLAARRRLLDKEHPDTLTTMNNL